MNRSVVPSVRATAYSHRRASTMPCPTIGISIRIGRLRQRPVRGSPLRKGRRPVYRGSDQGMPEADAGSAVDQLRVLRRSERALFDAELGSRAPDERGVPHRLGRGQQQQPLRRVRQLSGALEVVVLEVAREVCPGEDPEAARQLCCAHAPRQVEQGERVAAGFREDAIADAVVEPTGDGSHEKGPGVLLCKPAQRQLGQAVEVVPVIWLADGHQDRHRFREQPPRDETEDLP
jgi:hypothetical protein